LSFIATASTTGWVKILLPYYLTYTKIVWHADANDFTFSEIKPITFLTDELVIRTLNGTISELLSPLPELAGKTIRKM